MLHNTDKNGIPLKSVVKKAVFVVHASFTSPPVPLSVYGEGVAASSRCALSHLSHWRSDAAEQAGGFRGHIST